MFFPGFGVEFPMRGIFKNSFRAYPLTFIEKGHLENGDKVILPPSALDRLASLNIEYPMLFEIHNPKSDRTSHCGVLEFTADEGVMYLPYWMMENLALSEGDTVRLKSASLSKGTYVKFQPHTKDFLDISNPKAVLETSLRNFSCLTVGDAIMVFYNKRKYYINIIETKPAEAVTIIETDCEVDFAAPLDYVEPPRPSPSMAPKTAPSTGKEAAPEKPSGDATEEKVVPKVAAFTGQGRRLDGKPSKLTPAELAEARQSASGNGAGASSAASGQAPAVPKAKVAGKLVFGAGSRSGNSSKVADAKKEEPPSAEEKDESNFKPFSGKGYSLK